MNFFNLLYFSIALKPHYKDENFTAIMQNFYSSFWIYKQRYKLNLFCE